MTNPENIPANEASIIDELGERLKAQVIANNTDGIMRRDAHPKMHGLVQAEFTVLDNIPEELAVGLFSEAKTYPAWVRFSNASERIQPDSKKDIRGMAVKLVGVPGEKLLEGQQDAQTHDFLLISTPAFIVSNVAEFNQLVKAITANSMLGKAMFFLSHLRITWNILRSMKKFANPLQIRYFSATPYLFGGRAVKYSATPQINQQDSIPDNPSDNFLREAMVRQLDTQDVMFDFCLQLQTGPAQMPIEDASKTWDEKCSPFRKVASLRIPQQVFNTSERNELGENLSFNPWHALPEHRPLGGINRARRVIYMLISTFRHQQNGVLMQEPTQMEK